MFQFVMYIIRSEWLENLTKTHHFKKIRLIKLHNKPYNTSACPLKHDGDEDWCQFEHVEWRERVYYDAEWMGIKASDVVECSTHQSGKIDLLYDHDKIRISSDERVVTELVGETLPHHGNDDLITIMVTKNESPNPNRFIIVTEELITEVLNEIFSAVSLNKAYTSRCNKYANHMYKIYGKKPSLTRLRIESQEMFMSRVHFNEIITHVGREYYSQKVPVLNHYIALYPHREMSVDGTQPIIDKTFISDGNQKHKFDASLNANTAGGTGFILDFKIYPQKKETHGNQCDLLIDPIIESLHVSPLPAKLEYGIGIDHPIRDYGVAEELKELIIEKIYEEFDVDDNGNFETPKHITYNINDVDTFVESIVFFFYGQFVCCCCNMYIYVHIYTGHL